MTREIVDQIHKVATLLRQAAELLNAITDGERSDYLRLKTTAGGLHMDYNARTLSKARNDIEIAHICVCCVCAFIDYYDGDK